MAAWFEGEEPSAALMCERLVFTLEMWDAAIDGRAVPDGRAGDCLPRFDRAAGDFARVVKAIRDRGAWDDAFVDALCEPPQSFTYGGVVSHILGYGAVRRETLASVLAELGATSARGRPDRVGGGPKLNPALAARVSAYMRRAALLATLSATIGLLALPAVAPAQGIISSLSVNPSMVRDGAPAQGTVNLAFPEAVPVTVRLFSSDPGVASVPATAIVPAGSASVSFTISTNAAAPPTIVQIMAAVQNVPRTANLSVNAATPGGPVAGGGVRDPVERHRRQRGDRHRVVHGRHERRRRAALEQRPGGGAGAGRRPSSTAARRPAPSPSPRRRSPRPPP